MTGKVLNNATPAALALILPIAVIITLVLKTWQVLLSLLVLGLIFVLWQNYQWQRWAEKVNPFFNELVLENQGCLTPMDLSMKANLTSVAAKRFLDKKAEEFGAQRRLYEDKGVVYYFLTNRALRGMFADSEPLQEANPLVESTIEKEQTPDPQEITESSPPVIIPEASKITQADEEPTLVLEIATETPPVEPEPTLVSETSTQTPPVEPEPTLVSETSTETPLVDEEPTLVSETSTETPSVEPEPTLVLEIATETPLVDEEPTLVSETGSETPPVELEPTLVLETTDETPPVEPEPTLISETSSETPLVDEEPTLVPETSSETPLVDEEPTLVSETSSETATTTENQTTLELIQADLAKRLDVHPRTLAKKKSAADFGQWSKTKDPQGIAWEYSPVTRMFVPQQSQKLD